MPRTKVLSDADGEWTYIASGLESRAIDRFDLARAQLPPSVCRILENRPASEHSDAAVLALHLAEGRQNPRGTTQSLLAMSPGWIERQGARGWNVLACYAGEHGVLDLSAEAFERAAAVTVERPGRFLVAAAVNLMHIDRLRCGDLLTRADAFGDAQLLAAVAKTLLEHPDDDAGPRSVHPMLLVDSDEVRSLPIAQSLLSDEAMRSGDFGGACTHARLALDADSDSSAAMVALATTLIMRSNTNHQHVDDLPTAIGLLERALDQRRSWAGRTVEILDPLLKAYALSGQFEVMLSRCLPSPLGTASEEEAEHPHIRRSALFAAGFAGRSDLVDDLAARLGDSIQDRVARLRTGTLRLTPQEQRSIWAEELTRSITENDYEAIANSAIALASLGHDERSRLAPFVERFFIPIDYLDLATALLTARDDLDAALPALRSLARHNMVAAEYLIRKLTASERYIDTAQACSALYEHTGKPYFLIERTQCLIAARDDDAETAASLAANSTLDFPIERADLFTYLAAQAADRDEWDIAEKHLTQALRLKANPSPAAAWRVVLAQVKQGKLKRAAQTIAEHRPSVTSREEAQLWLQANAMVPWDEAKASEALTLAQRFNDDPRLSAALLGHIVTMTHGVDKASETKASDDDAADDANLEERRRIAQRPVSAELHLQAFAAIQQLAGEFGDEAGITVIRGEPEQLLDQMTSMAQKTSTATAAFNDIIAAAQDGKLPRGLIASITGRSFTTLLVQRMLGPLVTGAAADNEHELDMHIAQNALGKPVVVDAAALLVLTAMSSPARLEGQFTMLQMPVGTMWDIHRAVFDGRGLAGSPGTLGWDTQSGSLTFWELGDAEFTRRLRRTQALEEFAQNLTTRPVRELNLFQDLAERLRRASWLEPIQLAHDQNLALWSDDLGLRRLARHKGVPCFGTPALIDVLRDRALATAPTKEAQDSILMKTAAANRELAKDMVVDVALHLDDLLHIAQQDNWLPHAAGLVLSRPSWWAWQAAPFEDLLTLYAQIATNKPDSLPDWQYAAMLGAGRAFQPAIAGARILATLALIGHETEPTTGEAIDGVRRARQVADQLGLPDPLTQLPAAAASLAHAGRCSDPEKMVNAVLTGIGN